MEAGAMNPIQHGSDWRSSLCVYRRFRRGIGPRGRDLLIAEPSTEKECPRRLVRTDYRASDPKTPVRIRARALQGETSVYDAESVRQFERNLSASCYAADPGCDFSRCNGQPRGRESSCHSTLVQGPQLAGPFGGVS